MHTSAALLPLDRTGSTNDEVQMGDAASLSGSRQVVGLLGGGGGTSVLSAKNFPYAEAMDIVNA